MASLSAPPTPPAASDAPVTATSRIFPQLKLHEWFLFIVLACVLAATNIYTTLLIGWSDTGAIISALLSMLVLGALSKKKPSIFTINIGQSTASGGGAVGFAVATYACVRIVDPKFQPPSYLLIPLFAAMGTFGALIAATVRPMMVRYFFPTGTACAVLQKTVTREMAPGERNRPIFLLKVWGSIAALVDIPAHIKLAADDAVPALLHPLKVWTAAGGNFLDRYKAGNIELGTDPLYYGLGLVVGPRVGLGMLIGGLIAPLVIAPALSGSVDPAVFANAALWAKLVGDWKRWLAIAALTLPTFAVIALAYAYRTPQEVPPGFDAAGRTKWKTPPSGRRLWTIVTLASAVVIALLAQVIFQLPPYASAVTMIVAWPMCIVNGRVNGDTDVNPVRLVAVVILATLTFVITKEARTTITLLGMAIIGGTMAAVAVDMFQEYRTGHLLDADPVPMLSMQVLGACAGAIVSIPVLDMLIGRLGIGDNGKLAAPGAQIWAQMGKAMADGFHPSPGMTLAIVAVSLGGCFYAWLTIWPRSAAFMPSLFGIGIGMLLPIENSTGIFAGGLLHWLLTKAFVKGASPAERELSSKEIRNDMMLAGASIFAAAAVMSILLIVVAILIEKLWGAHPYFIT